MGPLGKIFMKFWGFMNSRNLDAPLVAVIWQELVSDVFVSEMTWGRRFLLFLAVWIVYCFDRHIDSESSQTARHRFHRKHPFKLRLFLQLLSFMGVGLAFAHLNTEAWIGFLFIGGWAIIHLFLAHNKVFQDAFPLPKEWRVGFIFAAGTILQPWSLRQSDYPHVFWVWLLLGFIFTANCLWFSYWDGDLPNQSRNKLFITNWAAVVLTWSLSSIGWQLGMDKQVTIVAGLLSLSGLVLLSIEWRWKSLKPESKQALGDLSLIVFPLIFLVVDYLMD